MCCFCGSAAGVSLKDGIREVTGFAGRAPTKLRNKWSGPHPFLRMNGDRYAFIGGKELRFNVNRLWKHRPWDKWHPDTGRPGPREKFGARRRRKESGREKGRKEKGEKRGRGGGRAGCPN